MTAALRVDDAEGVAAFEVAGVVGAVGLIGLIGLSGVVVPGGVFVGAMARPAW